MKRNAHGALANCDGNINVMDAGTHADSLPPQGTTTAQCLGVVNGNGECVEQTQVAKAHTGDGTFPPPGVRWLCRSHSLYVWCRAHRRRSARR